MTVSIIFAKLLILLLPDLVLWYIIVSQNVLWKNWIVVFKVKVSPNFKMLMNVCPDDIFWIAETFIVKLGFVMHHYKPDCFSKRMVCCLQDQGHSLGTYIIKIMTVLYVFWTADPFATKLGWMAHHYKLDCLVKRLDSSVVVKVKVKKV